MISQFVSSSPASGSVLTASDSASPSLSVPPPLTLLLSKINLNFFFNVYLFLRQRETEHEQGRGRGEGDRIWNRLQALSCQHRARCGAWTHKLWDHDLSLSQTLNRLSHPGAPRDTDFKEEFKLKWDHLSVPYSNMTDVFLRRVNLNTSGYRWKMMWRHRENTTIYNSEMMPENTPTLLNPWSWTFSLQTVRKLISVL